MNQRKFKGLLSIVLCAAVMLASASGVFGINTFAQSSGGTTGECTWSLDDTGTVLTISGNGKVDNLNRLGPSASQITKVIIESGVTGINNSAFAGCSGLKSITIPDSVKSIGNSAFAYCSNLKSITILDGVTSIGGSVFSGCSSLESITIPNSVTSIGNSAFSGCRSLKSITIPDGVTGIGNSAFSGCTGLESITIPDSVTSIGDSAFAYCSSLESITIPDSVTSIGESAFSNCGNIKNITVAEGNKKYHSAGNCVIETKSKVLAVGCRNSVIPSDGSVTSIGDSAFSYCGSLKEIIIPDSVTSIGDAAFDHCNGLKRVTLPSGITSIGDSVFYACASLEEITIPSGVTSIGNYTFYFCESLKSITIPDGLTSIGDWAFSDCGSLESITIPDSVTTLGSGAFMGSCIKNVYISDISKWMKIKFEDVGSNPLNYNASLYVNGQVIKNLVIPDEFTSIPAYSFAGASIESVTFPDGVTSIGDGAFSACKKLKSITIPTGVMSIGNSAFSGCSGLTDISIPNSVDSIGFEAFYNCNNIKNIYFGGTEEEWQSISVLGNNGSLYTAEKHYNPTETPEDKPSAPELLKKTAASVTLKPVDGYEYKAIGGFSEGKWQTSNVFTGLIPNYRYAFYRRTAANGDTPAGETSYALTVTTESIIRGDVNDDREINIIDLVRLKKYLANPDYNNYIQRQLCDVNGDDDVTADDLSALRKMLLAQ